MIQFEIEVYNRSTGRTTYHRTDEENEDAFQALLDELQELKSFIYNGDFEFTIRPID